MFVRWSVRRSVMLLVTLSLISLLGATFGHVFGLVIYNAIVTFSFNDSPMKR